MSGLDKMVSQILAEANHSAETKIAQAKEEADGIISKAKSEALAQVEEISRKSKVDITNHADRVASGCDMQRRKALLQAKQEIIAEVLDRAYQKLINLDDKSYFDLIRKMLEKFALPEQGEIYFSAADLQRLPQGFETEIQKIAAAKGGTLKLVREPKRMEGGFILVYGGIEENCTIKALFDSQRDELSDKVQGLLFV